MYAKRSKENFFLLHFLTFKRKETILLILYKTANYLTILTAVKQIEKGKTKIYKDESFSFFFANLNQNHCLTITVNRLIGKILRNQ